MAEDVAAALPVELVTGERAARHLGRHRRHPPGGADVMELIEVADREPTAAARRATP